ncbi:hypothetical protein CTAYLR_005487 [Chrysophaeum taylorii]|uniref:Vesicle transport protein n=1 Tax=Chrysophaeum taylorii TaxID=2483200 RepID=A0AAD7U5G2_9STRA|nr:hypothetical protein CTAYLR_005487 [Chrysophaeum taylorii]
MKWVPEWLSFEGEDEGDVEEGNLLPDWARVWETPLDDHIANAEDSLRSSLSVFTPWVERGSKRITESLEATKRFRYFVACLLVAAFLFAMAFFVGLPVLPLRPQKFAICFTLGSAAWMSSFAVLRGWKSQLRMLCARNRVLFTAAYFATMFATLYAAVALRSFILTVLCSASQFATLLYYLATFIPGGYRGVKLFLATLGRTASLILKPLCAVCMRCCRLVVG